MMHARSRAKAARIGTPGSIKRGILAALAGLSIAALAAQNAFSEEKIIKSHGYSFYGDLTYPEDYTHFSYVNPDAPKGGEISLALSGTFDSMNPYSRKGRAAALSTVMYESLLGEQLAGAGSLPADAFGELYGLVAHTVEYPESKDWVIFHMRPEAKFSDGTPVTAHDVLFSHNLLLDEGLQSYANAVRKLIPSAEVIDDHTIKFNFAEDISRRTLVEVVGGVPIWSKKWYEDTGAKLDESRLEISPGSGPYMLESVDVNRSVTFVRNPDYWGWDLPINKGRHNFDRIRTEYFADSTAAFEAFKAGEVTYRTEADPKKWATAYEFPAAESGFVAREELRDGSPPSMSGIVFNLGSEPLKDKRVRQAIALAYNFEWTNASLLYGLHEQQYSYSYGTEIEAKGLPEGQELAFLQALGDVVPEELFTEEPWTPHVSDADRLTSRKNLRKALRLFEDAGWTVGSEGVLENTDGEPLQLNFLFSSSSEPTTKAVVENFVVNLKAMGVDATLETVDTAQYSNRERDRDYDLVLDGYPSFLSSGAGLRQRLGSEDAAYSLFNPAGLASPLIDAIIDASVLTSSRAEEVASLNALDRALRYEFIVVPRGYKANHWVAYWDMYDHPDTQPPFALGTLDFWWFNQEKADALAAAGALK